jgi:penicillin-binding protein 1C
MKHFAAAAAFCVPVLVAAVALSVYSAGIDVRNLPAQRSAVTYSDRSGIPLGTVLASDASHAVAVPLAHVSPAFLEAIVAAEDARFYRHGAIDVAALARAAREWAVFGQARSGGSTIEMQLARLLHPSASTVGGKLSQILRAQRIAIRSNRTDILEAYVNRVPMGGNLYGVEAAARSYFGEPAADLDLAQASLLAAIPNDPAHLAPGLDWGALRRRQQYVLARMTELGDIDSSQAARAFAETLPMHERGGGIADAAHALFFLHSQGSASGGRVRTTIDRSLQRFVQAQTEDVVAALQRYHVTDAAALVVDNRTGGVLAYVGSPDYFSDEVLGRNDGVQALRQPGSSLKPFTYELALETGAIASTTILPDVPAAYALPGGRLYQPADYSGSFSGPVRVRYALANSLNVPAVRVLSSLGVGALLDRLHELQFRHLDGSPAYYGLGLTLGAGEVSLWELVQAYSTMARGGSFLPLHLTDGAFVAPVRRIGDPGTWALIGDMLADAHARAHSFGIHSVLEMPFWAAVKTGTSSDFRDTWTIGYTRVYTVGVWVGNFDGTPMRGVSGVTGAGPLWNRIMLHLHENAEPPPYPPPPGYVRATICASTGHSPSGAAGAANPDCGGIVQEWVRPQDLESVERPVALRLGSEYGAWLAHDPGFSNARGVRIVNPQQGDVFLRNPVRDALANREQRIALRAIGARGPLRWTANGIPLAADASGIPFFALRPGTWTLIAGDGRSSDSVTIEVLARREQRPGFTFRGPADYSRYRR